MVILVFFIGMLILSFQYVACSALLSCIYEETATANYFGTKVHSDYQTSIQMCADACHQYTTSMRGICLSATLERPSGECQLYSDNLQMFPESVQKFLVGDNSESTYIQNISCKESTDQTNIETRKEIVVDDENCGMDVQTRLAIETLKVKADRVVGGIESQPNGWPWLVELNYYGRHWCGASLVRVNNQSQSDIIISAQHCFNSENPLKFEVIAGEFDRTEDEGLEQRRKIRAIRWPGYPNTVEGDIVVVKLDRPVIFGRGVRPICLPPSSKSSLVPGHKCVVTGWGVTAVIPIYDLEMCVQNYDEHRKNDKSVPKVNSTTEICAGLVQGGKDSCQGDSGGPLMCRLEGDTRWKLTGVVSWGHECAKASSPGIYANVAHWREWIEETIQQLSSLTEKKGQWKSSIAETAQKWSQLFAKK